MATNETFLTTNATLLLSTNDTLVQGWSSTPNVRGTFDILWACGQTIILCAWTTICVNLPSPDDGSWELFRDKFHFALLTFVGPDLVFLISYSQLQSAQASVREFRESGYHDWTLRHAFYADMGGISVQPPGWKRFPVNAKQLHYLVVHGYLNYPQISRRDIEGRGKMDGLARLIAIGQALYFTVTTLARSTQGLAITTAELTTLGFVLFTFGTSACWWYKPVDVEVGHTFDLNTSIDQILINAGEEADGAYRETPLDFICSDRWAGTVLWPFFTNILRSMHIFPDKHKERPLQKFSSFKIPRPQSRGTHLLVLCLGMAYSAIFLCAWNFDFPTEIERTIWRIVSVMQSISVVTVGATEMYYFEWPQAKHRSMRKGCDTDAEQELGEKSQPPSSTTGFWSRTVNNSPSKHPYYDVPMRSLLFTTPVCAMYCGCRCFLFLEDLIGFRSVPSSVYQTVDWTQYWPSF